MASSSISPLSFKLPCLAATPHTYRFSVSLPNLCFERQHFQPSLTAVQRPYIRSMAIAPGSSQDAISVPRSVPVRVAHELLQAGHRYLDVRTEEEFSSGHAKGAINIPYMFKVGHGMTKNPDFLKKVSTHFGKHDEIIVGCQSGKRSLMAATDLLIAGYTGVTDIAGGYSAWLQSKLPTE